MGNTEHKMRCSHLTGGLAVGLTHHQTQTCCTERDCKHTHTLLLQACILNCVHLSLDVSPSLFLTGVCSLLGCQRRLPFSYVAGIKEGLSSTPEAPLIVFINARSGGRDGPALALALSRALGRAQVGSLYLSSVR